MSFMSGMPFKDRVVIERDNNNEHDVWVDCLYYGTFKTHAIATHAAQMKIRENDRRNRWNS